MSQAMSYSKAGLGLHPKPEEFLKELFKAHRLR